MVYRTVPAGTKMDTRHGELVTGCLPLEVQVGLPTPAVGGIVSTPVSSS